MYNWEKSKSSNSKSKSKSKHKYDDPKTPTFSSSFFNKFNNKPHHHHHKNSQILVSGGLTEALPSTKKTYYNEEKFFKPPTKPKTLQEEKMSSLRRACLVEKWMDKKVNDKVISSKTKPSSRSSSSTTLLEEFDLQDAIFFNSATTTTTSTSSTSSSEAEYSVLSFLPKQKPHRGTCFTAPPRPKPVKTHSIESNFIKQLSENNGENDSMNSCRSKAAKVYSNLKNLKQPISPGVKLTTFINSLFAKDGKNSGKKCSFFAKEVKTEEVASNTYSSCSSASSFSRSCMIKKNKRYQEDGTKRTVRFCPVSVIVDDDSQPCGYKSLREEKSDRLMNSKFGRSLSKRYEELRKLNGLEKESDKMKQQKKLEEVALDLLSGYWDTRLNKSHDLSDDYGVNHGVNYDQDEDNNDGFSCSSSDLFELDHLSLIGDELPVYETTQFDA